MCYYSTVAGHVKVRSRSEEVQPGSHIESPTSLLTLCDAVLCSTRERGEENPS